MTRYSNFALRYGAVMVACGGMAFLVVEEAAGRRGPAMVGLGVAAGSIGQDVLVRWAPTRRLRRARGRQRLAWGMCPACNSSPPRVDCAICAGDRRYGEALPSTVLTDWSRRWERLCA